MMRRSVRLAGHVLALSLFTLATLAALRYLADALAVEGMSPRALFGVLLAAAAASLVWRSFLNVRRIARRLRA